MWGDWARFGRTLEMIGFVRGQPQKLQGHGSPSALCAETPPWLVKAGMLRVHWGRPEATLGRVVPFPQCTGLLVREGTCSLHHRSCHIVLCGSQVATRTQSLH